jgi:hypothetical protein
VHAEAVRAGKVSVPTAPLGAIPPAQFVPADQFDAPVAFGVAPLQVKFVSIPADAGCGKPRRNAAAASAPVR